LEVGRVDAEKWINLGERFLKAAKDSLKE